MDDTISRQAAIDAVYKCADIFAGDMPVMVVKADAYEALAQLPSAQQWIPVTERLPEVDELVLVTDDSGGVKTVDVDRCGEYEASSKRFWYYTQNVTAWMPLPKAYKEVE